MNISAQQSLVQRIGRIILYSNNLPGRPVTYISNSVNVKTKNFKSPLLLYAASWLDDVYFDAGFDQRIRKGIGLLTSTSTFCRFHNDIGGRLLSDGPTQIFKGTLDDVTYETVAEETLQSLAEYFDELMLSDFASKDADVSYSSGVLTVVLGEGKGIYVINKQSPNKQIWLSSPVSGPKRYDFINGRWIYKHDGMAMHDLLTKEITEDYCVKSDFTQCLYG